MIVETQITIDGTLDAVWAKVIDIENMAAAVNGIDKIEILERPDSGLLGLKWRETRTLMGKSSSEVMWVTDVVERESFTSRAESNGFVYLSATRLSEHGGAVTLMRDHRSEAQSFAAKVMSIPMGLLFKGMMRKAILKDLRDFKAAVEK